MRTKRDDHMFKLSQAFLACLQRDNCEYGAIGVDCKRPFGNSDVEGDILEIIGEKQSEDREYAAELYNDLIPWLQRKYLEK